MYKYELKQFIQQISNSIENDQLVSEIHAKVRVVPILLLIYVLGESNMFTTTYFKM